jgi:hypothetical protein
MQAYQDAMAIVRSLGIPDVFLTFTCNPSWLEIQSELPEGQIAADRPDLVARVFQMKVKKLLRGVCKGGWLAQVIGNIWTREYQKRGLPHIHLLLIFPRVQKVTNVDDIDRLVSAELLAIENVELYEIMTKCFLHGPCGPGYPNARCMVDGMCKNVIRVNIPRQQRKVKTAMLFIGDAMMGEHSKKIRVDLYLTIDGWYRTTPI